MNWLLFFVLAVVADVNAKTIRYELTATRAPVNLSGKKTVDFALMINGKIPAPTLEFTEGDEAEITVINRLEDEDVSIHWHGILLPPLEDGVPFVNTPPILPGASRIFKFKIRQHGTYWYHSHTNVQEQKGLYGAIKIHPKAGKVKVDHDVVAILSDWADENPTQILKNLKKDGDYYLYKKGTMRSIFGATRAGGLGTYLHNEWTRMGGMDLSDVGYDAFLINGKRDSQLVSAKPGEKVRVRLINAGGSSYFNVTFGGGPLNVISADGMDIEPVKANGILMGMAETYDFIFTVPEQKNFELRATAQDGTGHASAWIGQGEKVLAPAPAPVDLYAPMDHGGSHKDHASHMNHNSHTNHHNHGEHSEHQAVLDSLTVDQYMSPTVTAYPEKAPRHDLKLVLGGDMRRYVWYINGKAIHQDRTITIREGEVVRFTMVNETMMHHPIHLHGHFFRVLNGHDGHAPLKHTVDVPPHGERTIEFLANEPGDWMLHCHNLYHMKTGMARVVSYASFEPTPEIKALQKKDPHLHDHLYYSGLVEAATNHAKLNFKATRTWDMVEFHSEGREEDGGRWEFEGDLVYRRHLTNFFSLAGGAQNFDEETRAIVGVGYMLPFLIESNLYVDHEGELRLDLDKHIQWTKNVFSEIEFTFLKGKRAEYEVSLMYGPSWSWSAGLMLTEQSLGAGGIYRF